MEKLFFRVLKEWLRVTSAGGIIAFTHKVSWVLSKRFTIFFGFIFCLEIPRPWLPNSVFFHPHFAEPGVRRLGERAKGIGGARTVEARIQVSSVKMFKMKYF